MQPELLTLAKFKPVLENKLPWLVVFSKTDEHPEAVSVAEALDGFGRVGVVNTKKNPDVLKFLVMYCDIVSKLKETPH